MNALLAIRATVESIKEWANGKFASSWNDLTDKPFVVANLSFETMKLDITLDEIVAIQNAGGLVLLRQTMTVIGVDTEDDVATGASTTTVAYAGEGSLAATTFLFSADGTMTGAETSLFTGTVLG